MRTKRQFYTPSEVREILGVRQQTIYMLLEAKLIPAFRIGNRWKIPIDTFDDWMDTMAKGGATIERL